MTTEAKKRKFHTAEFNAQVGLQVLAAEKTVNELAQQHKVHPVQVRQWKASTPETGPKPEVQMRSERSGNQVHAFC
jgi:transposase-like protein